LPGAGAFVRHRRHAEPFVTSCVGAVHFAADAQVRQAKLRTGLADVRDEDDLIHARRVDRVGLSTVSPG
jgi:hypothetical protein